MIRAKFRFPSTDAGSFDIEGHAGYKPAGEDIVCAAVSSAAYLTVNTLTEVFGVDANATEEDGKLVCSFSGSKDAVRLLKGLRLHLEQLQEQYPKHVKVTTEV